ncbi:MAG: hypothetical protein FWE44_02065 [Defluviitaleaceae bacterium]|nr:hypothetical protein [Defluviitaleaceae bacterium]
MFLRKDQKKRMTRQEANEILERAKKEEPLELEKGDMTAIILAALKVFVPFILLFAGAMLLIWWLIMFVWAS